METSQNRGRTNWNNRAIHALNTEHRVPSTGTGTRAGARAGSASGARAARAFSAHGRPPRAARLDPVLSTLGPPPQNGLQ